MARGDGLRTSLAGWAAALAPLFRARTPTTSTTPTGSAGNVAPAVHPTYSFGNQPPNNNQNKPGNDPTALWGNVDFNRFNTEFPPGQLFGPERPLIPQEFENVRIRNYPVAENLQYTPRAYQPVGFPELRALAREVVLVRLAIETRKDQIEKLDWAIKPKDEKNAPAAAVKRATDMEKFWRKPDGVQSFAGWLRESLEEVLVVDAPAFEVRRTRGGDIIGLDCIAGDTIKVLIDETGRWPKPPAPAFLQVIHGRPWRLLTSDQLIYAPRNRLVNSPYGYSPVEQTILFANIALRRSLKQLAHFTEGNVPAGMITGGEGWSPETLKQYYEFLNSELAGNIANQTRLYLAPFGASYQTFTEAPYKDDFDEWMARIICFAFSLPPTAFTKTQNRGEQEAIKDAAHEEGMASICGWVKRLVDDVIQTRMGQPDLEFVWNDEEDIDPQTQSEITDQKLRAGRLTLNEARDLDGLEPIEGGDEPMIYLPSGPVLLKDVEAISGLAANPPKPIVASSPNAAPGGGSSGSKPSPAKPGGGKPAAAGKPKPKPSANPQPRKPTANGKVGKAAARSLYVSRQLKNSAVLRQWAKDQGFASTLAPADMHVTIAFSKEPMDWDDVGDSFDEIRVPADAGRSVEKLGDEGAVVLRFHSKELTKRWQQICDAGASWDYPSYKPHISISYKGAPDDLDNVEPYTGELIFGPERFNEIADDWDEDLQEIEVAKTGTPTFLEGSRTAAARAAALRHLGAESD